MTQEEYEAKCAWLRGYGAALREAARVRGQLRRWRSIAERVTPAPPGVRYARAGAGRLETAVEQLDTLREVFAARLAVLAERRLAVEQAIGTVPDARQRLLLQYRYVDGLAWAELAARLGVSVRRALQLHRNAVASLDFTPEV